MYEFQEYCFNHEAAYPTLTLSSIPLIKYSVIMTELQSQSGNLGDVI